MRVPIVRSLALLATCALTTCAFAQQPYRVVANWKIGGTGGWDYLLADPSAHMLYVTHGQRVEVVDTETGKPAGAITGLKGTHGIALDSEGKVGYISDGGANAVIIFDRKTFAIVGSVTTGTNPDGIAFEPVTKTIWAFNGTSKNATVIDAAKRTVVATTALPGKPEFPQVDGKGNVFVNIEDKNSILKLDAKTNAIVATWPIAGCESPSGLSLDADHMRLFAVCDGKKMGVVDANTGKLIGLANVGEGPDAAGYNAKEQLAFASNGDGTLSIVDTKSGLKTVQTVATRKGARTMAYDAKMDRVYLSSSEYGPKPEPTAANPKPRAKPLADSFSIVVVGRK